MPSKLDDPKCLLELVAHLVAQAEALPKGDRDREKLLRVAHSAADWAERMAIREQFAWGGEEAAMDAVEAGAELPTPPEPLPDLAPEWIPLLREGAAPLGEGFFVPGIDSRAYEAPRTAGSDRQTIERCWPALNGGRAFNR
jgi:hypothetical protein